MISLIQNEDNLIGSREEIELLAKKKEAHIMLISDSHGKATVMSSIIQRYGVHCDALILCGDTAIDFAATLGKASTDEEFKKCLPPVIALAAGNGDPSSFPVECLPSKTLRIPRFQKISIAGKNIFVTHGHYQGVDFGDEILTSDAFSEGCTVIFHGHTHVRREERIDGFYVVNPGSCSRPRDGRNPGFAITTIMPGYLDTKFIDV